MNKSIFFLNFGEHGIQNRCGYLKKKKPSVLDHLCRKGKLLAYQKLYTRIISQCLAEYGEKNVNPKMIIQIIFCNHHVKKIKTMNSQGVFLQEL